jgi:hypothetical protein
VACTVLEDQTIPLPGIIVQNIARKEFDIMILPDHKILFVHIPKTGGTSVRSVLRKHAEKYTKQFPHQTYQEYAKTIKSIDEYFSFTIVRNTWDRVVSLYTLSTDADVSLLIDDFPAYKKRFNVWLESEAAAENEVFRERFFMSQLDYLTDKEGKICVDHISKFDNMETEWEMFLQPEFALRGLETSPIPHVGKSLRKSDFTKCYTKAGIKKVEKLFAKDIEYFKFEYPKRS